MVAESRSWRLADEAALQALAAALAPALRGGGVIYLEGELGAGKTSFARATLRALGEQGPVRSPTYTLVEPYELAELDGYHFDLYRLSDPAEMEYLGARDCFGPGALCLIEWPDRGRGWLPPPDLRVLLAADGAGRAVVLEALNERAAGWLRGLRC